MIKIYRYQLSMNAYLSLILFVCITTCSLTNLLIDYSDPQGCLRLWQDEYTGKHTVTEDKGCGKTETHLDSTYSADEMKKICDGRCFVH